jgi:hypothetical protein
MTIPPDYDPDDIAAKVWPMEIARQYADDPGVASLLRKGLPLSRASYIARNFDNMEDWNHEHEASLPEIFQDPHYVEWRQEHPDE